MSKETEKTPTGGNRGGRKSKRAITSTNATAQRQTILDALKQRHGLGITTLEARQELGIMSPAPRVKELRVRGYHILTIPTDIVTDDGVMHQGVARYVLLGLAPESEGSHA